MASFNRSFRTLDLGHLEFLLSNLDKRDLKINRRNYFGNF